MSTYSEQIDNILQEHLLPKMRALSIEVAKYEPFSYTSTTLEDRRRQLDYYSMLYDFLVEYRDGSEELTSSRLMNIVRLLEAPSREKKSFNLFTTKPVEKPTYGFKYYINDLEVSAQTVLTPGDTVTIRVVYTYDISTTGVKSSTVYSNYISSLIASTDWEIIIPNFEIEYAWGGTNLELQPTASLDGVQIDDGSKLIPIAYMIDRTFYYGVGAPELQATEIQDLSVHLGEKGSKTFSFSPESQVFYFAYPKVYGELTSILDPNGFDMISDFILSTKVMSLYPPNYGGIQEYYCYEYDLPTIQTNFNITFSF